VILDGIPKTEKLVPQTGHKSWETVMKNGKVNFCVTYRRRVPCPYTPSAEGVVPLAVLD
jgi:hypothetical protein